VLDAKLRILWASLAISGALLGIGAGYRSGGLAGLRELTLEQQPNMPMQARPRTPLMMQQNLY
jgi:hypothetical protein